MKKRIILPSVALALTSFLPMKSEAGSRGFSGGGSRSFSSGARSFSRSPTSSYSRPSGTRTYAPSSSRSVTNNNTTVVHQGGGGWGGGSGMFWGYMLGQSMSSHPAPAAPAPIIVMPQGGGTPQVSPDQSTAAPIAPVQPTYQQPAPEQEEGGLGFFGWLFVILGISGIVGLVLHYRNQHSGVAA